MERASSALITLSPKCCLSRGLYGTWLMVWLTFPHDNRKLTQCGLAPLTLAYR